MNIVHRVFNEFREFYHGTMLWLQNRWYRLLGAVALMFVLEFLVLFTGLYFRNQVVLALGTIILTLLGLVLYLRIAVFSKALEEMLPVIHKKFDFVPEILAKEQFQEIRKGFLSGLAWLIVMHILFATVFVKWTEGGMVLLFLAIRLFGAIAVPAWGLKTDKYRNAALVFCVTVALMIVTKALVPSASFKGAWDSISFATSSVHESVVKIVPSVAPSANPAPPMVTRETRPQSASIPAIEAREQMMRNMSPQSSVESSQNSIETPKSSAAESNDSVRELDEWYREVDQKYPEI